MRRTRIVLSHDYALRRSADRVHQWLSAAQVATMGPRLRAFRLLYVLIMPIVSLSRRMSSRTFVCVVSLQNVPDTTPQGFGVMLSHWYLGAQKRGALPRQRGTMREIVDRVRSWQAAGERVAIATVLTTVGSTPRPAGAKMAITAGGKIVGSISGGCVDTDVIEHAVDVLRSGRPQIIEYGYSPDMSWEIGLMCGGSVQVFVEPLGASPAPVDTSWLDALSQAAGDPVCTS